MQLQYRDIMDNICIYISYVQINIMTRIETLERKERRNLIRN